MLSWAENPSAQAMAWASSARRHYYHIHIVRVQILPVTWTRHNCSCHSKLDWFLYSKFCCLLGRLDHWASCRVGCKSTLYSTYLSRVKMFRSTWIEFLFNKVEKGMFLDYNMISFSFSKRQHYDSFRVYAVIRCLKLTT